MPKKILIAMPPSLLQVVDQIASYEHRNRSELIREALRRYIDDFNRKNGRSIFNTPLEALQPGSQQVVPSPQGHTQAPALSAQVPRPFIVN